MAKSAAARMRLHRKRLRQGLVPVVVDVDEVAVCEMLIAGGFLLPHEADDKTALRRAIEQYLRAGVAADFAGYGDAVTPYRNEPR